MTARHSTWNKSWGPRLSQSLYWYGTNEANIITGLILQASEMDGDLFVYNTTYVEGMEREFSAAAAIKMTDRAKLYIYVCIPQSFM